MVLNCVLTPLNFLRHLVGSQTYTFERPSVDGLDKDVEYELRLKELEFRSKEVELQKRAVEAAEKNAWTASRVVAGAP